MNVGAQRGRSRTRAGEGRIGLIIGIIVVAALIYGLTVIVPVRIERAEMKDFAESKMREYVVNQITHEQLVTAILGETKKRGLPVTEDDLTINDTETSVTATITYDVTKRLIGGKEWVSHQVVEAEVPRL